MVFNDDIECQVEVTAGAGDPLQYQVAKAGEPAGSFRFETDMHSWSFDGSLSKNGQLQVAAFIQDYTDLDWDN